MTSDVITVRPEMSIKDAATLLLERSVSGVVVVDEADHALGVVSETDILYSAYPGLERGTELISRGALAQTGARRREAWSPGPNGGAASRPARRRA